VWPIARTGLLLLLRHWLFWLLYALSLMIFLMYFFGQYLLAWFRTQIGEDRITVGLVVLHPGELIELLADKLKLNGSAATYANYIHYQGYMVMIVLALAGSGVDRQRLPLRQSAVLPVQAARPAHYLLGKGLAVAAFINLMTTLPALVLFVEYGLVYSWDHFTRNGYLVAGILGYGAVLTVCLTLLLLATAAWLRRPCRSS